MDNRFIVTDGMINDKKYDGNTLKFGITVSKQDYIVKLPEESLASVYSEYVASRVIQKLGIPTHEVWIGEYNGTLVNIIKDFTNGRYRLKSFKDTRQSSEGTDMSSKSYTYKDVLYLIEKHTKMNSTEKQRMKTQFWQMFICDAILANRDRHHGNWGYLSYQGRSIPAPIYDNGGCLFPDVYRVIDQFTPSNEKNFLFKRSEYFPASLFMITNKEGKVVRSNYYEMLSDLRVNRILAQEVKSIRNNIGYKGIYNIIQEVVNSTHGIIPPIYGRFYIGIVCMRYLHMIERKTLEDSYKILKRSGY